MTRWMLLAAAAAAMGTGAQAAPGKPVQKDAKAWAAAEAARPDQLKLLHVDNVVSDAAKAAGLTLEGLGIAPESIEAIVPQYLWRFRATGQFQRKSA